MRIHQEATKIYHTCTKSWVYRDLVIRFFGNFVISELGSWIYIVMAKNFQICFYPTFFFSINSTYMKRILHSENVTPKSSYNWLKIRGFFQSGEGTWLEFLWGGGTKLELGYWVKIVIINQIPPGGGTANLKSRNLSRKKVSCTTILRSTWRGHFFAHLSLP